MKLWVFGDSNCLPLRLESQSQGWPSIVSNTLKVELVNLAQPGVDNFFIYQSILKSVPEIQSTDQIIIGWSHPNRKVFVLDRNNPAHTHALSQSTLYLDHDQEFFRSNGPERMDLKKMLKFDPDNSGIEFFDRWFGDYHHSYEQQIAFQAYIDSISIRLPSSTQFYFSYQSINSVQIGKSSPMCILDFVLENSYNLTDTDYHANAAGHQHWAELLLERINQKEK